MASQSEPSTTTDVLNYVGEAFYVGATFGKAKLLSLAGLTRGAKIVVGSTFNMANTIEGDAAAQDGVTEDSSLDKQTDTSYTAAQVLNTLQIFDKNYVVSYAAQALTGTISGVALGQTPMAIVSGMPVQRLAHFKQFMADYQESAHYGSQQVWTNAATAGKMDGLFQEIEAGSETAAAAAPLSKILIETEITRMADAGAEFGDMVLIMNAFQNQAFNTLYGNAIESQTVAGIDLQVVRLPVIGTCRVMYDPAMNTDDFGFVDMTHYTPTFGIVPGKPAIFVQPLAQLGASTREMLYSLASIDFGNILFHGMISGLATS